MIILQQCPQNFHRDLLQYFLQRNQVTFQLENRRYIYHWTRQLFQQQIHQVSVHFIVILIFHSNLYLSVILSFFVIEINCFKRKLELVLDACSSKLNSSKGIFSLFLVNCLQVLLKQMITIDYQCHCKPIFVDINQFFQNPPCFHHCLLQFYQAQYRQLHQA